MIPSNKFVCNCRSVSKHEILRAIRKSGAQSFVDVQHITLAATGCGRCKSEVMRITDAELERLRIENKQLRINFDN